MGCSSLSKSCGCKKIWWSLENIKDGVINKKDLLKKWNLYTHPFSLVEKLDVFSFYNTFETLNFV